ncbi:MAG: glycosyltransferase family 9 protein [Bryobacteraceae bacterium]|nr:glycosyltransferase family 9 protein [Bryobacteraceae bacterium]
MTPRKILVVRMGAMGDIIHTLPAVVSLRRSFPEAQITWAVEQRWAPLLEHNGAVDKLEYVNRRSLTAIRTLRRNLKAAQIDLAVDFQGLIKSALVCHFASPERIIGMHRSAARESLAALFYSRTVTPNSTHVVDRNLELAAAAGATSNGIAFPLPPGEPEGSLPAVPFVLACPLAGWISKQWPLEYYSELGVLLRQRGFELVLNAPSVVTAANTVPHVSGIPGLIHAIRRASAIVGVDSGPLHLAAALGRPGVAIFGPTDPARNGPYGNTIRVIRNPGATTSYKRRPVMDPAMRAVTPAEVFTALEHQL